MLNIFWCQKVFFFFLRFSFKFLFFNGVFLVCCCYFYSNGVFLAFLMFLEVFSALLHGGFHGSSAIATVDVPSKGPRQNEHN